MNIDSQPPQSFSAAFELQGDASRGSLRLFSPLGNTMAELVWDPRGAELRRDGRTEQGATVQDLLWQVSGTDIPLAALFEWLQQRPAHAPGWVTETSSLAQGRLLLRRTDPLPTVELRIRLEE